MAKPIDTIRTAFGKDIMKVDVRKILIIIEMPNSQYFFAILIRSSLRRYWNKFVKIIGNVSKDIATVVSITRVRIAITAGGRPIPRKPLIIPANRKAPRTISVIVTLGEGDNVLKINSINLFFLKLAWF